MTCSTAPLAYPPNVTSRTIKPGVDWWHLVVLRSRRTHWLIRPDSARATMRLDDGTLLNIPAFCWPWPPDSVPALVYQGWYPGWSDGGIMLHFTAAQTLNLPAGSFPFDILANFARQAVVDYPVSRGTIHVVPYDSITPRTQESARNVSFTYDQYTDWMRYIQVPLGDTGDAQLFTDAYMVIVDDLNAPVATLRWISPAPNEAAIAALPANERGYISSPPPPNEADPREYSCKIHISDKMVIAIGEYSYRMYATIDGDQKLVMAGSFVVRQGSLEPT